MASKITPFLMFQGSANEAIRFYVSLFPRSEINHLEHYVPGEPGAEGTVKRAELTLVGQRIMCIDSPVKHAFTFTPSMSLFVECESETELDAVFQQFAMDGQTLMPLANYGFSRKFGWLNDRFGVSWQLNLQWSTDAVKSK
ncbi:MAG: VOC family protein [Steroidobacteraceae bacterium]